MPSRPCTKAAARGARRDPCGPSWTRTSSSRPCCPREGSPAKVLRSWLDGGYELVVSAALLDELERALRYPKLRARIPPAEAARVVAWLRSAAILTSDPTEPPPVRSVDPGDDDLLALAAAQGAMLVSGDGHLLELGGAIPVLSPAAFLEVIDRAEGR